MWKTIPDKDVQDQNVSVCKQTPVTAAAQAVQKIKVHRTVADRHGRVWWHTEETEHATDRATKTTSSVWMFNLWRFMAPTVLVFSLSCSEYHLVFFCKHLLFQLEINLFVQFHINAVQTGMWGSILLYNWECVTKTPEMSSHSCAPQKAAFCSFNKGSKLFTDKIQTSQTGWPFTVQSFFPSAPTGKNVKSPWDQQEWAFN